MNITNNSNCTFCKSFEENLCHLFFDCQQVRDIWNKLETWIFETTGKVITIGIKDVIFGILSQNSYDTNIIISLTKQYISLKRYNKQQPHFTELKTYIVKYCIIKKKNFTNYDNKHNLNKTGILTKLSMNNE